MGRYIVSSRECLFGVLKSIRTVELSKTFVHDCRTLGNIVSSTLLASAKLKNLQKG